jgi:hypothetical protein
MRALLSGLLMMTAVACASALDFDVSQAVPEQIVSGSPLPAVLSGLFAFPLQVDIQSQIAAHKTGPISEITLSGLVLDITATKQPAGDTDDWSFLTHADLFVASTKDGTTLAKVKVATVDAPGKVQQLIFVQPVQRAHERHEPADVVPIQRHDVRQLLEIILTFQNMLGEPRLSVRLQPQHVVAGQAAGQEVVDEQQRVAGLATEAVAGEICDGRRVVRIVLGIVFIAVMPGRRTTA